MCRGFGVNPAEAPHHYQIFKSHCPPTGDRDQVLNTVIQFVNEDGKEIEQRKEEESLCTAERNSGVEKKSIHSAHFA